MAEPALPFGGDWPALRRRFAGEALARVLAFCGWRAEAGPVGGDEGIAPCRPILLRTEDGTRKREVGPVELLWQGTPLDGAPPDWPREVPADAARFFLTARPLGEPAGLDLDLAARRDGANPFYVTRYTERRLCALLSRREPEGLAAPALTPEGRVLALEISRFPAAVRRAAEMLDPFPVNRCALALAGAARDFLRAGGRDRPLLAAAEAALGNAMGLLGVGERDNPQSAFG